MSLSALASAVADLVHVTLTDECGRPSPSYVFRYHNAPPQDCCTDDGVLSVHWAVENASSRFPSPGVDPAAPCQAQQVATLVIRYGVCWSVPTVGDTGVQLTAEQIARWDADAAMLADVADCVARALRSVECKPDLDDPFMRAIFAAAGTSFRYIDVTPLPNLGGCTGVQWRVYAAVRSGVEAS